MRRVVLGLVALAGCRQIFGITEPPPLDAGTGDVSALPDASSCKAAALECADDVTLRACAGPGAPAADTHCTWGCLDTPEPHCGELVPHGGAVVADDATDFTNLTEQTISAATVDGSAGAITSSSGTVRAAGQGVQNGIDYEVRGGVAIFRMKKLVLSGAIALTGPYAIAIVTEDSLTITGDLDMRGACTDRVGGPGGFAGGTLRNAGGGPGGGIGGGVGNVGTGGGGGGFGAVGGNGGTSTEISAGGAANGDTDITMLVGGSGGGAGNGMSPNASAHGGGGGGALQLVSNTTIVITGSINASGCGGNIGTTQSGGGGGGAGGALLLEAPVISIGGQLAVNGGGGAGGGSTGQRGHDGAIGSTIAAGGSSLAGSGGAGGAGTTPTGTGGEADQMYSGGGGGGAGRIRLNTKSGMASVGGELSPPLMSAQSTAGTATVR